MAEKLKKTLQYSRHWFARTVDASVFFRFVMICLPLFSLAVFPFDFLSRNTEVYFYIELSVLLILPVLIVATLSWHKIRLLAIPLYLIQFVGLAWFSYYYLTPESFVEEFMRILFLMGSIALGVLLILPDSVEVIFSKDRRSFRLNRRIQFGQIVKAAILTEDVHSTDFVANVIDISKTGLQFSVMKPFLDKNMIWLHENDSIHISIRFDRFYLIIPGRVVWLREEAGTLCFGLHVEDHARLEKLFKKALEKQKTNSISEKLISKFRSPNFQKVIAALWAIGTFFTAGAPSCQRAEEAGIQKNAFTSEDRVQIDVMVIDPSQGLGLIDHTNDVKLRVSECVSGLVKNFTMNGNDLSLYSGDKNCQIELTEFKINSEIFVIDPNVSFNPSVGAINPFIGTKGSTAQVIVVEQLDDPLELGSSASFEVYQLKPGQDFLIDLNANVVTIESLTPEVIEGTDFIASFKFIKVAETSEEDLEVYYEIDFAAGNVTPGSDYVNPSGSFTIPAGIHQYQLDIDLIDDPVAEPPEMLIVKFTTNSNYFSYGKGGALIQDDDSELVASGLVMAFDQGSLVVSGSDKVTNWTDHSNNGNDGFQNTASKRPSIAYNSVSNLDGVNFDGIDDLIQISDSVDINTGGPYDNKILFAIFKTGNDINRRQLIYEQGGSVRGLSMYLDNGLLYLNGWNVNNDDGSPWNPSFVSSAISSNTVYLAALVFSSSEQKIKGYVNGSSIGEVTDVHRLFSHSDDIGIGGPNGGTLFHDSSSSVSNTFFEGEVAELLAYNGPLSLENFQATSNYLSQKYGLQTPVVQLNIVSPEVIEGSGESGYIRLSRSYPSPLPLTVNVTYSGSATPGLDYVTLNTQLVIPAFTLVQDFPIVIIDDDKEEPTEFLAIDVNASTEYIIGKESDSLSVLDDDAYTPPRGYILWNRADLGVATSGSLVSGWDDRSHYSHIVSQTRNSRRPSYLQAGINGLPAIEFASGKYLNVENSTQLNTASNYQKKMMFFSFRTGDDVNTRQFIYEQGGGSRGIGAYVDAGNVYVNAFNFPNDDSTTPWGSSYVNAPVAPNTEYVLTYIFDQTRDSVKMRLNGQQVDSASSIGNLFAHSGKIAIGAVVNNIVIHNGSKINNGANWRGRISEILQYNSILSTQDMQAVESYLISKYVP